MCRGPGTGPRREFPKIRPTRSGPEVVEGDGWSRAAEVFKRCHCIPLENFLERRVAARLRQVLPRTQGPRFDTWEHRARYDTGIVLVREMKLDECAPAKGARGRLTEGLRGNHRTRGCDERRCTCP